MVPNQVVVVLVEPVLSLPDFSVFEESPPQEDKIIAETIAKKENFFIIACFGSEINNKSI